MTEIKKEFIRLKGLSLRHFLIALTFALIIAAIAVKRAPLYLMELSLIQTAFAVISPMVILFLFYAMVNKPERSVFRSVRYLYYAAAPVTMLLLINIVFDPTKAETYSTNFFNRFMPLWGAFWWLGTILAYILMRTIETAEKKSSAKGGAASRLFYALAVMYTPQTTLEKHKRQGGKKWLLSSVCIVMIALAVFIFTVTVFLHTVYSNMAFEAILFTIRFAAGGLALEDLIQGFTLFVFFAIITGYLCFHLVKCFMNDRIVVAHTNEQGKYTLTLNSRKRSVHIVMSALFLAVSAILFSAQTHFIHYLSAKQEHSSIYDSYYVKPEETVVSFPGEKRNLIYIFLESIENTYASKDVGGALDKNYIPELTEITEEKDCVNFSNTEKLGGASVYVPSITYTQGSTVAQTSGISLNIPLSQIYTSPEYPSMLRLEDILHNNGYEQLYIEGSKGEFSLYDKYVGRYENSKVFDRKTASDEGYTDESADYIWKWGIEDRKLIEITKELITDISQKGKPFFVTMYTMDTHTFECGHRCPDCDSSISNDYLASVDCASRQIKKFVDWIRKQPFFENTTVILVGDHLGNEKTTLVDIDDDYVRTTYNCIINPAKQAYNTRNRLFSSLDMFPTTLSAIGAEIKGDRLGLGTDLFSDKKTLCEELGEDEYKTELERTSEYYKRVFYGS